MEQEPGAAPARSGHLPPPKVPHLLSGPFCLATSTKILRLLRHKKHCIIGAQHRCSTTLKIAFCLWVMSTSGFNFFFNCNLFPVSIAKPHGKWIFWPPHGKKKTNGDSFAAAAASNFFFILGMTVVIRHS